MISLLGSESGHVTQFISVVAWLVMWCGVFQSLQCERNWTWPEFRSFICLKYRQICTAKNWEFIGSSCVRIWRLRSCYLACTVWGLTAPRFMKNELLLDILARKGPHGFKVFCGLRELQPHLKELLSGGRFWHFASVHSHPSRREDRQTSVESEFNLHVGLCTLGLCIVVMVEELRGVNYLARVIVWAKNRYHPYGHTCLRLRFWIDWNQLSKAVTGQL